MKEPIEIRAHHFLCIPRFYRGGYNQTFADNMKEMCQYIRHHPLAKIRVIVAKPDVLCLKCPHWHKDRCVQSKEIGQWVVMQDKKVAKYLGLKPRSIHIARDVFNLSMEKVNNETIESVCKDCIFLENCVKVGVNNSFRKDLNN